MHFNPRSPCGERHWHELFDRRGVCISIHAPRVGSDRSRRRCTVNNPHFNPRSPCGERRAAVVAYICSVQISIHAPRVGSDSGDLVMPSPLVTFQSTLPVWGATHIRPANQRWQLISIHAPRVGSDGFGINASATSLYFNPRSPCGERQALTATRAPSISFQSTLPVWGATRRCTATSTVLCISIHAPRVGSDERVAIDPAVLV